MYPINVFGYKKRNNNVIYVKKINEVFLFNYMYVFFLKKLKLEIKIIKNRYKVFK